MTSHEERMKVVKALREPSNPLDIHASLYSAFGTCAEAVATTVPADYYEHNNRRLLNRLADLIDRPTCTVRMGVTGHVGVCMRCGAMVEMRAAVFGAIEALPTRYCPHCGAKVAE